MKNHNQLVVVKIIDAEEKDYYIEHQDFDISMSNHRTWLKDKYPNITEQFLDLCDLVNQPVRKALTQIAGTMIHNDIHTLVMDCDVVESDLTPAKEMTLDDIEKELGYKIKLVEKEN